MTISAIILSHFKEREGNLKRIVDDLLGGTIKPQKIIIFIDNPQIQYVDDRVTIIRSDTQFKPNIRFAIGAVQETDYCFFIDDDLSVGKETLENFVNEAEEYPDSILGYEGSILGHTDTPYSNDQCINRGLIYCPVDIIIRTYFCPTRSLMPGLYLRAKYPELPKESLDDVFLSLGNKYLNKVENRVISILSAQADLQELPDGGVGQSYGGSHYENRNKVCRFLMDIYE